MPKYVYRCTRCSEKFEAFHSMTEELVDCDRCNKTGVLERLPTSFNVQKENTINEVGSLVKSTIKELQEELVQQKKELQSEHDPNK